MTGFRAAFPDLNFWGTADLIAEGDYVVGQWEGGGTHTGPAFKDFLVGSLPAATGRKMRFTGTTVLKVIDGKIAEEVGASTTASDRADATRPAQGRLIERGPLVIAASTPGARLDRSTTAHCRACSRLSRRSSGNCC